MRRESDESTATAPAKLTDMGADLFLEAKQRPEDELERESLRVRWKLDFIIVPLVRRPPP